jgi:hypothetical protein
MSEKEFADRPIPLDRTIVWRPAHSTGDCFFGRLESETVRFRRACRFSNRVHSVSAPVNRFALSRDPATGRHGLNRQGSQLEAERGKQTHDGREFGIPFLAKRPVQAFSAPLSTFGNPGHALGSGNHAERIAHKIRVTGFEGCRQILGACLWRVQIRSRVESRRSKHGAAPKAFEPVQYPCPVAAYHPHAAGSRLSLVAQNKPDSRDRNRLAFPAVRRQGSAHLQDFPAPGGERERLSVL